MVVMIQDLKLDLEEAQKLAVEASRPNIKSYLQREIERLKREVTNAEDHQKRETTSTPQQEATASSAPKRFTSELTNYAWDQSDKFIKLFITLDGIDKIENPDSNVCVKFTEKSMEMKILNFKDRDYVFVVNNLLEPIVVEKSYRKVKADMVAIYLKKAKDGSKWSHLTITAKQLKDMKDTTFKDDADIDSSDPSASLMNMMKKLYDSGDPEMKRMITKTWQESSEKRMKGEPLSDFKM